jgi:hypothetical protein
MVGYARANPPYEANDFLQANQRDLGCPVLGQKIFRFSCRANQFYQLAPSFSGAIVTNAGWDVVDASASARKVIAGRDQTRERFTGRETSDVSRVRQNRVVLTPVAGAKLRGGMSVQPGSGKPSSRQRR